MLLASLSQFESLFHKRVVAIDDPVFLLHHGVTSYILLFCSILVTGRVYLGEPAQCSLYYYEYYYVIPKEMLNIYCYIHSTFIIPKNGTSEEEMTFPGIFGHNQEDADEEGVVHSYYQWVSLVLFLQGMSFFIPHFLWRQLENGLMKSLRSGLNQPSIQSSDQEKSVNDLVNYFKTTVGRHGAYGRQYLYCVFANLANVVMQILFTHYFLGNNFLTYGLQFSYGKKSKEYYAPEDVLFPKMSKCHLYLFGPSGTKQLYDGLCVLPLNMLHDKIYLILWYWYIFLFTVTLFSCIYWMRHYLQSSFRLAHLEGHLKGKVLGNKLKPFNRHFGDWFVLHQIYKNVDRTNFYQLVSKLCGIEPTRLPLRRNETFITLKEEPEE